MESRDTKCRKGERCRKRETKAIITRAKFFPWSFLALLSFKMSGVKNMAPEPREKYPFSDPQKVAGEKKVVAQILQAKKHDGLKTKFQKLAYFSRWWYCRKFVLHSLVGTGNNNRGRAPKLAQICGQSCGQKKRKEITHAVGLQPRGKKNFLDRSLKSPPEKVESIWVCTCQLPSLPFSIINSVACPAILLLRRYAEWNIWQGGTKRWKPKYPTGQNGHTTHPVRRKKGGRCVQSHPSLSLSLPLSPPANSLWEVEGRENRKDR